MAENCSVLDTWMYRSYACISEAAIERENDALTKALQISLLRDSSSAPSAIPSPESFSTATSSLLCLPAAVNECHRRDPPAGRVAKKRRSRASKRSPTTYIAADPANFRELVQRATGTRAAGSAGEHQYPAAAVQGSPLLPTLDTSSFLHDRAGCSWLVRADYGWPEGNARVAARNTNLDSSTRAQKLGHLTARKCRSSLVSVPSPQAPWQKRRGPSSRSLCVVVFLSGDPVILIRSFSDGISCRPCALARPRSSQRRGGARLDGKSPRVRLGRSAAGVVELRSGRNVSARIGR
ncbi:hypothetical protein BHE74_00023886 [Ensete ventricosum]|nr:hypothetical protein BHE74_00023886 [Ensete ventricosum]